MRVLGAARFAAEAGISLLADAQGRIGGAYEKGERRWQASTDFLLVRTQLPQSVDSPAIPFAARLQCGKPAQPAMAGAEACRQVSATVDIVGKKETE